MAMMDPPPSTAHLPTVSATSRGTTIRRHNTNPVVSLRRRATTSTLLRRRGTTTGSSGSNSSSKSLSTHSPTTVAVNTSPAISSPARSLTFSTTTSNTACRNVAKTTKNPYILRSCLSPPHRPSRSRSNSIDSALLLAPLPRLSETAVSQFKTSPYVGWFRHAPPTFPTTALHPQNSTSSHHQAFVKILQESSRKSTPFVMTCPTATATTTTSGVSMLTTQLTSPHYLYLEKELRNLLAEQEQRPRMRNGVYQLQDLLTGHLRGGIHSSYSHNNPHMNNSSSNNHNSCEVEYLCRGLREHSAQTKSYTVKALSKLACWLLLPFYDASEETRIPPSDYCEEFYLNNYCHNRHCCKGVSLQQQQEEQQQQRNQDLESDMDSIVSSTSCEEEEEDEEFDDYDAPICRNRSEKDENDCQTVRSNTRSSYSSLSAAVYSSSAAADISVSSQAEAYYAHQAAKQDEYLNQTGEHRLDYVITQMDIVRMTRNANRHLDVESIWQLPTITYSHKKRDKAATSALSRTLSASSNQQEAQQQGSPNRGTQEASNPNNALESREEWSWMMVRSGLEDTQEMNVTKESNESRDSTESKDGSNDDDDERSVCVICLEHFADGDRLRVLPCDHSFHVGCIDRWLSGSHSFDDCYTTGCPTCKKHATGGAVICPAATHNNGNGYTSPTMDNTNVASDGAVPSWAFTRIADALSRES